MPTDDHDEDRQSEPAQSEDPQSGRPPSVPDPDEPKDTDRVTERTTVPSDGADTRFDPDAPGNFVDDRESPEVPEPNEPA